MEQRNVTRDSLIGTLMYSCATSLHFLGICLGTLEEDDEGAGCLPLTLVVGGGSSRETCFMLGDTTATLVDSVGIGIDDKLRLGEFVSVFLLGIEGHLFELRVPTAEGKVGSAPGSRGVGGFYGALGYQKERVGWSVG